MKQEEILTELHKCNFCKDKYPLIEMFEKGLCLYCFKEDSSRVKELGTDIIKKEIKIIDLFETKKNIFEDLMDVLKELGINLTLRNLTIINRFIIRTLKRLKL